MFSNPHGHPGVLQFDNPPDGSAVCCGQIIICHNTVTSMKKHVTCHHISIVVSFKSFWANLVENLTIL